MWNNVSCNASYEKFLRQKELRRFQKSLIKIGPQIDNSKPKNQLNLKIRTKKSRLQQENFEKIEQNNQHLLKKMMMINLNPSGLNKEKIMPRNLTAGTLNLKNRIKSQNKIYAENKRILEKLQSTQSFYSAEKWENEYQYHKWVKITHSKSFSRLDKKFNPLLDERTYCEKLGISYLNTLELFDGKNNFYKNYEV